MRWFYHRDYDYGGGSSPASGGAGSGGTGGSSGGFDPMSGGEGDDDIPF